MDDLEEGLQAVLGDFRSKLQELLVIEVKIVEHRIKHEIAKDFYAAKEPEPMQVEEDMTDMIHELVEKEIWGSKEDVKSQGHNGHGPIRSISDPRFMSLHTEQEFKTRTWKDCFLTVAHSPLFDLFWAFVIASNALVLGIHLTWSSQENFMGVHVVYACLYATELIFRLVAEGPKHYFTAPPGRAWNWLDVIVVSTSWLDIIVTAIGTSVSGSQAVGSSFRVFRLLRVSRLLRIVKTLWIIRFVGALRTLVNSLVDTFKPLFWAMLLLFIVIYIVSVLFTDVTLEHLKSHDDEQMAKYFGTLGDTLQTLFRSISGGFDWVTAAEALRPMGAFWVMGFQLYIVFSATPPSDRLSKIM